MISFDTHFVHSLEVSSSDDQRPQRWWTIKVIGKTPDVEIGFFNLPQPTGELLQAALSPLTTPDKMIEAFVNYRNDETSSIHYTLCALSAAANLESVLADPFATLAATLRLLHSAHVTYERLDQADELLSELRSEFDSICDELCDESASLRAQLQPE